MARTPRITRTIPTTIAKVLVLNVDTKIVDEQEVSIPRKFKNMEKLHKAIERKVNTETTKLAHILSTRVEELLYGMTEQFFIDHSEILPPRAKAEEAETTDETEEADEQ